MADIKISALSAGTPAAAADLVPVARAGSSLKLTVQEILEATHILSLVAPTLTTDEILAIRSGVAKRTTLADVISLTAANLGSRRNLFINGNFDWAQYNITYNLTTTVAYGSVDRWGFKMAGTADGIAYQVDAQVKGFVGFKNCLRLGRNNGSVQTGLISAQTVFETIDCEKFQGKNVVLSFYAKAGANFSAASSLLGVTLATGKGTDQSLASFVAGTWTSQVSQIAVTQAITTSVVRYQFTVAIPTDISQIGFQAYYTPAGTAGADDNVYLTGFDLSEGTVAPPVEFRHLATELALCQRYLPAFSSAGTTSFIPGNGLAGTTTECYGIIAFPVTPRVPVTGLTVSAASHLSVTDQVTLTACTAAVLQNAQSSGNAAWVRLTVASGLTQFRPYQMFFNNASGKMTFTGAEL
jgi:hypothetical protein